jgi:hypothetical protein
MRIPLTVYEPQMPRARLRKLTAELLAAPALCDVVAIIRRTARAVDGAWKSYLLRLGRGLARLARAPTEVRTPLKVFSLKNTKLRFANFSTLPEFTCPGAGECLDWCYSFTAWRNAAPWARQMMNSLLMLHRREVVTHHFRLLAEGIILRLYVDGDFADTDTVAFWMELLRERPDIRAYGYSKSWDELLAYANTHQFPANYMLNLSGGGAQRTATLEEMLALPITRGRFLSIPTGYRPNGKRGKVGWERYDDPAYHAAVRKAAQDAGLGKVFSCPGKCFDCAGGTHACGSERFRDVTIVNGVH